MTTRPTHDSAVWPRQVPVFNTPATLGLGPVCARIAVDQRSFQCQVQATQQMRSKLYATGELYVFAGDGYVVIGSDDGQLRLYSDRSLSRANTAIPGLGAPITSVDVTFDGKWVLATTDKYLMVVKTTYKVP
jgi:hypothetical protein